jgi:hypothetical protein
MIDFHFNLFMGCTLISELIFFNKLVNFYLFKFWVVLTGLPDSDWSLRSKFLPPLLDSRTQYLRPWYLRVKKNSYHQWIPVQVTFLCIRKSVNACCLMHFNTVGNESSILSRIQCRPLCTKLYTMANWSSRNKEPFGRSSAAWSHHLCELPSRKHYLLNALCNIHMISTVFTWLLNGFSVFYCSLLTSCSSYF